MPLYAERQAADRLTGQQIVEQLGAYLAGTYQAAETYLLTRIAQLIAREKDPTAPAARLFAIEALRQDAARTIDTLDTEQLARRVVEVAMREGDAAAIEALGFTLRAGKATPPATGPLAGADLSTALTPQAATASAQLGLELTNALGDVNARILRTTPDVYQQTIAHLAGQRLLGGVEQKQAIARAATAFLAQGIPGFTDSAGRSWRIGTYAEMATRTATNRAWIGAHEARFTGMGVNLVQIIRGADACPVCAAWAGRVLAMSGPTGDLELDDATEFGRTVTVHVDATLAEARAGGWNHPNCRCTLAAVFPGLSLAVDATTYDPQASADRDRLRYLERRVRQFKREADLADAFGDPELAAAKRAQVRYEQGRIREHVAETGQLRKRYREQLHFSDGAPPASSLATPPRAVAG